MCDEEFLQPDMLYLTAYSWELGGINCDHDCSMTALVPTGPELFSHTSACPSQWLGRQSTTVVSFWDFELFCVDAFGHPDNREAVWVKGRYVYRIDVAFHPPEDFPYNNEFVPAGQWSREWRPMDEFNRLREVWKSEN